MLRSFARTAPALRRSFATEAAVSQKLNFSFVLPSAALYEKAEVDLVCTECHAIALSVGLWPPHLPCINATRARFFQQRAQPT